MGTAQLNDAVIDAAQSAIKNYRLLKEFVRAVGRLHLNRRDELGLLRVLSDKSGCNLVLPAQLNMTVCHHRLRHDGVTILWKICIGPVGVKSALLSR